jgi:uncharacterized membrane protein (UPF0127 family)
MRVRHEPAGDAAGEGLVLARNVEVADTMFSQMKGLMFREELPEDFALAFEFDRPGFRLIHMLFVQIPLDVLWLRGSEVVKRATLSPWTGVGVARADRVLELPAGTSEDVAVGDAVVLADD